MLAKYCAGLVESEFSNPFTPPPFSNPISPVSENAARLIPFDSGLL